MAEEHNSSRYDDNRRVPSTTSQSRSQSVAAVDPDGLLLPKSQLLKLDANNHHVDLDTLKTEHPIILEILKNHPLKYALSESTRVPEIYLQQFWHTMTYVPEQDNYRFEAQVDDFDIRITKNRLRRVLQLPSRTSFPGKKDYDDIPAEEEVCADIMTLGYNSQLTKASNFKRMHLPKHWNTLFSIINRCFSAKHTGVDKCSLHILQIFHGVAFNKHYDYSVFVWQELMEVVAAKSNSRARKFLPLQRFLQLLIRSVLRSNREVPQRPNAVKAPEFEIKYLKKLKRDQEFRFGLPISEELLRYANPVAQCVRDYRASLVDSEPSQPTPEATPRHSVRSSGEGSRSSSSSSEQGQDIGVSDREVPRENDVGSLSRVATSAIRSHVLGSDIEEATMDPAVKILHTQPRHSGFMPKVLVLVFHGELSPSLSTFSFENVDLDKSSIFPFETQSALLRIEPQITLDTQAQITHLSDVVGTSIVAPSVDVLPGLKGSLSRVKITPTLNVGHIVDSTVVSTGYLCDPGVTQEYVSKRYFNDVVMSLHQSFTEQIDSLRTYKGKEVVTVEVAPPSPPAPVQPAHEMSIEELKGMLYSKLLEQPTTLDPDNATLIELLRQTQEFALVTDNQFNQLKNHVHTRISSLSSSIQLATESITKAMENLAQRMTNLEQTSNSQARSRKRRHDDLDDRDSHKGESKR